MVLESFAANCIGWLPPAFVSLMIDSASEVQGERRAELARCISNASAKVLHFSPRSKFQSSNWGDFQHQFTPFLTSRNFRGINPQYTAIVFYFSSMAGNNIRINATLGYARSGFCSAMFKHGLTLLSLWSPLCHFVTLSH